MRRDVLLWVFCGVGGGFLLGLLAASLITPSPAEVAAEMERLKDRCADLEAENTALKAPTSNAEIHDQSGGREQGLPTSSGGVLEAYAKHLRPGSWFHGFASEMAEAGLWDPTWYWSMEGTSTLQRIHWMLTVVGEGKIYVEAVILLPTFEGDQPYVALISKPGELADLKKARDNRFDRVVGIGRALGLTPVERLRLLTAMTLLPIADAAKNREAMLIFVQRMPARVKRRFLECLTYLENPATAESAGIVLDDEAPAVGIPLSDRWVAEFAFCDTEGARHYDTEHLKPGPWWTIVFSSAASENWTSTKESKELTEEMTAVCWPRLTIEEVDALTESLKSTLAEKED